MPKPAKSRPKAVSNPPKNRPGRRCKILLLHKVTTYWVRFSGRFCVLESLVSRVLFPLGVEELFEPLVEHNAFILLARALTNSE
jgi:hypothetical protein